MGGALRPDRSRNFNGRWRRFRFSMRFGRSFLNPLTSPATVSALPSTGVFAFGNANLGAQVGAFGKTRLIDTVAVR